MCRSPGVNLKDGSQGAYSGVSADVGDVVVLLVSTQHSAGSPLGVYFSPLNINAPESFRKSARSARTCHCQSLLQAVTIVDTDDRGNEAD